MNGLTMAAARSMRMTSASDRRGPSPISRQSPNRKKADSPSTRYAAGLIAATVPPIRTSGQAAATSTASARTARLVFSAMPIYEPSDLIASCIVVSDSASDVPIASNVRWTAISLAISVTGLAFDFST